MTSISAGPIKAVVFDIGGVLLDWNPRYLYRSLIPDSAEMEQFFTEVAILEWNMLQDAGRSWADAVAELTGRFPHRAELIRAFDERWVEMIGGPLGDTVEVLRELRRRGVPTYALTNFSAEKWPVAVAAYDFLREFEGAAVVSGVEKVMKPEPEIYRILLERFGLSPETTFFTDDREENVVGARNVGLQAEVFLDGATLRGHLRGLLT
ncbi:HAD family hydrolase [Flindersiella endophytica]